MKREITLNELEIIEMIEKKLKIKNVGAITIYFQGGIINPKSILVKIN